MATRLYCSTTGDIEVDTDEWMGKHSGTANDDDAMVLLLDIEVDADERMGTHSDTNE